jgi:4-amino-4-deoxy-L-arabinose transferase-like glycosyltransferase
LPPDQASTTAEDHEPAGAAPVPATALRLRRSLPGFVRRHAAMLVIGVLAAGFVGLGAAEAWRDSPTFDEPVYVSAGLAAIEHQDLTLNDEHPPLMKVIAALPVLLVDPVIPPNGTWSTNDEHDYSATFLSAQISAGKLRAVDFASRILPLLLTAAIAFLLFGFANELFGGAAGLLCGVLWLASPFVLGLGHLDGVDMPFAFAVVCFGWALLRWSRERSRRRLVVLGLAGGLAALTDATGLLILAVGAATATLVVLYSGWRASDRGRQLVVGALAPGVAVGVIAVIVVWIVYALLDPGVLTHPLSGLPEPYVDGLRYLDHNDNIPAASYLVGVAWTGAHWWYWPVSLAVKLPPATLAVLVLGPLGLLGVDRGLRWEAILFAGVPAALLFGFNLHVPRDIGVRYLLPVIALWLVLASGVASRQRWRILSVGLVAAGVLGIWSTVASFPNSLSWTSPAFAAPYRVATNSSVDWGQDLFLLQSWARTHPAHVAYFGPRGITHLDIPHAQPLLGVAPDSITGWVAVSATDLTTGDELSWLRAYCPVGNLGNTILLYHFTKPPSAAAGPTEPVAACRGSTSTRTQ